MTTAQRRLGLIAVLLHMLAVGLTLGIIIPLAALVLERWGVDGWLIGLVAAMPALANLLILPWAPRLVGRFGAFPAMIAGCLLGIAAILLMPLLPSVAAWAALRFALGAGLAMPWLVGETWLNALAREATRGRVMAAYAAALFLGFAIGPLLLAEVGTEGWSAFLLASFALVGAVVALLPARRLAPPLPARPGLRILQVGRLAPTVVTAAFVAGVTEAACFALLPVYATRNGLAETAGLQLLSAFLVGGILLQAPFGWLADRMPRHKLLATLALGAAVIAVTLPFGLERFSTLLMLVFLLGGGVLGFYSLGLALLGQRFRPSELAVANAAFILCYEVGFVAGPTAAGAALDLAPSEGLGWTLAAIALVLSAVAWSRSGRSEPRGADIGRSET